MKAQDLATALRCAADINESDGRQRAADMMRNAASVIDSTLDEMEQMRDELAELRLYKANHERAADIMEKVARYFPTGLTGLENPSH